MVGPVNEKPPVISPELYKTLVEDMKNKREEMRLEIIKQLFGVIIVSLRDEFKLFSNEKYGTARIHRFIDRFNENMGLTEEGVVTLRDFNKWCEENNINYEVRKMMKK